MKTHAYTESPEFDQADLRLVRLRMIHPHGGTSGIELLRSLAWISDNGVRADGRVFLNMPEMSVEGEADVLAIEPCPPLESGAGRLVTGVFRHTSGIVCDLKVESERSPLGVTGTHPFWSCDRQGWVSAAELRIGETLRTLTGTTRVESIRQRPQPEAVFNIEVEGDHVYRVGESGVLVHNESPGCNRRGTIDYGDEDDWGVTTGTSDHYSGRPTGVHAILTPEMLKTGTEAKRRFRPPGWEEIDESNRARGHLLGNQLGGSGDEPLNLVALYQNNANDPAMKQCENRIADALRCGQCIEVWITPRYSRDSGAPTGISIRARRIGGGNFEPMDVTISNTPSVRTPPRCTL